MSRVDEALRRAAERSVEGAQIPKAGAGVAGEDIGALASEPFPLEMPDRRAVPAAIPPVRAVAPAEPAPPVPAAHTSGLAAPGRFAEVMAASRRQAPAPPARTAGALMERIDEALAEKVVVDANILPSSREQYRRLAATLHHAQRDRGLKVVMITSAAAGEGKTLTASNLALTLSESYRRSVLLIDADLRRPVLHSVFRIDNSCGLSEGLVADEAQRMPARQISDRLAILPAGRPSADPMAGLTSDRMRRLIDEARAAFDWVIIDTPPVALLPDANLLGAMVDGVIVVVKAASTPHHLVKRALDAVGRTRVLGVVLNRATEGALMPAYSRYDEADGLSREASDPS